MRLGHKCFYQREIRMIASTTRYRNILRFPRAAGEPPRATHSGVSPMPFLPRRTGRVSVGVATGRGYLSRPGVYVYFFRLDSILFGFSVDRFSYVPVSF